ncbi:MAG: hypothetical protein OJF51_002152 [Nitrospira sp.]|jgi:hypothetical protein|nr:MAG: hypothetical protein OJF51_002152 [Nitrospira sp.]
MRDAWKQKWKQNKSRIDCQEVLDASGRVADYAEDEKCCIDKCRRMS